MSLQSQSPGCHILVSGRVSCPCFPGRGSYFRSTSSTKTDISRLIREHDNENVCLLSMRRKFKGLETSPLELKLYTREKDLTMKLVFIFRFRWLFCFASLWMLRARCQCQSAAVSQHYKWVALKWQTFGLSNSWHSETTPTPWGCPRR